MKTKTELGTFFLNTIVPQLNELEELRGKTASVVVVTQIGVAAAFISIIILIFSNILLSPYLVFALPVTLIVWLICGIFIYAYQRSGLAKIYGEKVIKRVLNFFESGLEYFPDQRITKDEFKQSQLFINRVDSYISDNLVMGETNNISFKFAPIDASYRVPAGEHDGYLPIFKGLLYISQIPQSVNGSLFVVQEVKEKTFNKKIGIIVIDRNIQHGSMLDPNHDPFIGDTKIEDNLSKTVYIVNSPNPDTARSLLSNELVSNILGIFQKKQKNLFLAIHDDKLYFAIPNPNCIFVPELLVYLDKSNPIWDQLEDIRIGIDMIQSMGRRCQPPRMSFQANGTVEA